MSHDDKRPTDPNTGGRLPADELRELLLFHLYGALDESDEARVAERLESDPAARALLDEVRAEADLLSKAAQLEAGDMEFQAPDVSVRRTVLRLLGGVAAAAALVGAVWLGGHQVTYRQALAANPALALRGPSVLPEGAPAVYEVEARDARGEPFESEFTAVVHTLDGDQVWEQTLTADAAGKATFEVAPDVGVAGELLQVSFQASPAPSSQRFRTGLLLRTPGELLSRVSTDKPLYRPGDVVRLRTVLLERFRLRPTGRAPFRVEVTDPAGEVVHQRNGLTQRGVGADAFELSPDAPGGVWTVRIDGDDNLLPTEHEFQVRAYRAPRLLFDAELDRDGYGAGDAGHLDLAIERAEGGIPAGSKVRAVLSLDGDQTELLTTELGTTGELRVAFELPDELSATRAVVAVRVTDGGTVETHVEPIPLRLGRVDVALLPESGDLVAGLPQRVYFRVTDPAGRPTHASLRLHDERGVEIATFEPVVQGLGRFEFTPRAGARYQLVGEDVDVAFEQPTVREQGAVLTSRVDRHDDALDLELRSTRTGLHEVVAVCRGTEIARRGIDVTSGEPTAFRIESSAAVGGVVRVTVFDPQGFPVAERLVARTPPHRLDVEVRTARDQYAPAETVRVDVTTRDETGAPAPALLGARVLDKGVIALADDEDTASIDLHFLLGLDVEELEDVADFAGTGPDAALATDLLLGVQGWRRFAWRDPAQFTESHPELAVFALPRAEPAAAAEPQVRRVGQAVAQSQSPGSRVRRTVRRFHKTMSGVAVGAGLLAVLVVGIGLVRVGRRAGSTAAIATGSSVLTLLALFLAAPFLAPTVGFDMGAMAPGAAVERMAATADAGMAEGGELLPESEEWLGDAELFDLGSVDPQTEIRLRDAIEELEQLQRQGLFAYETTAEDELQSAGFRGYLDLEQQFTRWQASEEDVDADDFAPPALSLPVVIEREYRHRAREDHDGVRIDFADLLYWRPLLVTDEQGRASFEFDTSDLMTTFAIEVEAHDGRGALATGDAEVTNRLPFFVEPTLPASVTVGDVLRLPVSASTLRDDTRVEVGLEVRGGLEFVGDGLTVRTLTGSSQASFALRATAPGEALVIASGRDADGFTDQQVRTLTVVPRGYPQSLSVGGAMTTAAAADFSLPPEAYPESLRGELTVYPGRIATLRDALTGMLRMPGGCFEQTSSGNYPNVLALQLLDRTGTVDVALARQAREYLDVGYERLTGYECSNGGFEWWGSDPGHPGLTAYGLLQFQAMSEVYDVDPDLIPRTRRWLLDQSNGQGGFQAPDHALHSWVVTPSVADAYITWALVEAGGAQAAELAPFVERVAELARSSDDPYVLALAARTLGLRDHPAGEAALERLVELRRDDDSFVGTKHSIVGSTGHNLELETTALAALALLQADRIDDANRCVDWLLSKRDARGTFGSTQATVLSLMAMTEFTDALPPADANRTLAVRLDGNDVGTLDVATSALQPARLDVPLRTVGQASRLELAGQGEGRLPWTFGVTYRTRVPPSAPDCAVRLTTALDATDVRRGDLVGLTATVRNVTDEPVPMTLVRLGLPAGLEPATAQLDELRETGRIAFYELRPQEIVLYLDGLAAGAEKTLALDLLAAIPGEYESPAGRTYLYYTDDLVHWTPPLQLVITE